MLRSCVTPIVLCLCLLAANALAQQSTVLFDGSSMDAWRGYDSQETPAGWEIADGALYRGEGGGDIMTREQYGDFDLKLEWKISPGGNSGIIYRAREGDPAAYFSGPEFQVLDDAADADADKRHTAGALYGLYACSQDAAKPAGEWNTSRIIIKDNRVEHWLNGTKVVECEIGGEDWNERVSKSKFDAWKQFGKSAKGHILLQDHGDPVWYRNISIVSLDSGSQNEQ